MIEFKEREKTKKGDAAEALFCEIVKKINNEIIIITANTYQNRKEHWDIKLIFDKKETRIDVKAIKNCQQENDSYTIIEILDICAFEGWLHGMADYIAFQSGNSFVVVNRKELVKYHLENTKNEKVIFLKNAINKLYTRNSKDLISVVHFNDLKKLSKTKIIYN